MSEPRYIQAILPLKLDWLPTYLLKEGQEVSRGSRIRVSLAGKEYPAVVARTGVEPDFDKARITPVLEVEDKAPVSENELKLWEFTGSYYMCTTGEVFLLAHSLEGCSPKSGKAGKTLAATPPSPRPALSESAKEAVRMTLEAFQDCKPVLLVADSQREKIYAELSRRCIEAGRDALILRPELLGSDGPLRLDGRTTPATKRELSKLLREGSGNLVYGTRNALFLPWTNLGLIIVDEEYSRDYKLTARAPRFNARDLATVLASIHGADVLMCAEIPSLETLYNVRSGRYALVRMNRRSSLVPEIVDTVAERRKKGMLGNYSRILLSRMERTISEGGRVLLLQPWKDTSDAEIEARGHFPKAGRAINAMPLWKADGKELAKYGLTVLLNADYMLSKHNFRADELACREIERLKSFCLDLLIQTSRADHPVFRQSSSAGILDIADAMLAERKSFGLPPYTREIRIIDGETVQTVFLPKDRTLASRKAGLLASNPKGTVFDVDPRD